MKRLFIAILMIFILSVNAYATDRYVRPNGSTYGTGNGSDWNNAYSGFSAISWSSIACGDTIWVAGGNYTQSLNISKSCSSSSPLNIRRARSDSSESTNAAGWSSGFDSTIHHTNTINFNGTFNYNVISGRTAASGGSHGWWMDLTSSTSFFGISFPSGSSSNNTFEYMDIQGPGSINYSGGGGRAIDQTPSSGTLTGNVFSHMKIWDCESAVYDVSTTGSIYEYIEMYDIMAANWSTFHPDGIIISGSSNGIVRYCNFHKGPHGYGAGEGVYFASWSGSTNGWQVYGNIFAHLNYTGVKAIEIENSNMTVQIWNNTFDDIITGPIYFAGGSCSSSSSYKNNLSFAGSTSCGSSSNNLATTSSGVVVNRSGGDYHITSTTGSGYPRNAGTNLSSYFRTDMDGTTFGGDGTWDIGAFEYNTGGVDKRPSAPTLYIM